MGCRGGGVSVHLRKVCGKCGKHAHLRKVESTRCIGKQGYNMLSWRWRFRPPSEGVRKTRKTAHLRKVESARCIGKQGYNMLSGRWRFCPPSEGVRKTRETAHLRKVESARCIGKQGYNMLSWRWRFSPPPAERTRLHRFGPHSLSAVGLLG